MKKKLLIFGAAEQAEISHYYFSKDSDYTVSAFVVDEQYVTLDNLNGLPVVAWGEAIEHFSPTEYALFVALGYTNINESRKNVFERVKQSGYECPSYISSRAIILSDAKIGENTLILENNVVQPFVQIGSNTTIWSGNHIGHHSFIEDHVFIASHVVISGGVTIEEQSFIGVNATIRDHITIGARSVIGAGSIIMKSTERDSVYIPLATQPRNGLISADTVI